MKNLSGNDDVHYVGEFVLTREGSINFGEISREIACKIRRQTGKIRLRIGEHDNFKNKGYGEKHIERPERLGQIKNKGYNNARDFVYDIVSSFDIIYKGKGLRLILSKNGKITDDAIFIELVLSKEGDFYDVKTGLIARKNYFKNKTPLWIKPKNGV